MSLVSVCDWPSVRQRNVNGFFLHEDLNVHVCGSDPSLRQDMQTGREEEICMGSSSTGELFDLLGFNTSAGLPAKKLSSYFLTEMHGKMMGRHIRAGGE